MLWLVKMCGKWCSMYVCVCVGGCTCVIKSHYVCNSECEEGVDVLHLWLKYKPAGLVSPTVVLGRGGR